MKTLISSLTIFLFIASCAPSVKNKKAVYLQTDEFSKFNYPFSEAVRYGNILYASGQIGDLPETGKLVEGGIVAETNQAMKNIKAVLERYGSSMDNVIKCTCMLADIAEWSQMSQEYIKYFPNHKPARSAFGTTGLALGARVEIECMAYIDHDR
ncbi:MAG: Rid family hydrolase [Cyclobacteriaceae bacterium]|nr:Rid family hydrolase [Cyclobacteriaceae bacterium]